MFGIVTKCSLVRPKVVKSFHYCAETKTFSSKEYRDVTSLTGLPTGGVYPQRDEHNNPLETEYGRWAGRGLGGRGLGRKQRR